MSQELSGGVGLPITRIPKRLRHAFFAGGLIGAGLPCRVFISVGGDTIQVFSVLTAGLIAVATIALNFDPDLGVYLEQVIINRITDRLDSFRVKILDLLSSYLWAIGACIAAKAACVWFADHAWAAWTLGLTFQFIAGGAVAVSLVLSKELLRVHGYLHVARNLRFAVKASRPK